MIAAGAPDPALVAWLKAAPSVRCSAEALAPWTQPVNAPIAPAIPSTRTAHFERALFSTFGNNAAIVARGRNGFLFLIATVPAARAVMIHAGSEAEETSYSAVIGEIAGAPPKALVTAPHAERTREGLGLGSTRAHVERVLGVGHAQHTSCGTDVVRYVPLHDAISEAHVWFVYRNGVVVAMARYEAV